MVFDRITAPTARKASCIQFLRVLGIARITNTGSIRIVVQVLEQVIEA